jgi:DNA topoisomerase-6 subunit B
MSSTGPTKIHQFEISIDIQKNKPVTLNHKTYPNEKRWHGAVIDLSTEADYTRAMPKILEYLMQTAIVAPYATITYVDPRGRLYRFDRATVQMPKPPHETLPHPYGVDVETMKRLIELTKERTMVSFLKTHFHRVGKTIAASFLSQVNIPAKKNPKKLTPDEIVQLVNGMKSYKFLSPDAGCLSPLGEELLEAGIKKELAPEFVAVYQRKPSAYAGYPFIVEVGAAYGGEIKSGEGIKLFRFANKIPLLFDEASDVSWKVVNTEVDWRHYKVSPDMPIAVFVHICSTKVPYKTVGKEFIADRPDVEREILNAVREVARRMALFLSKKIHLAHDKHRLDVFQKYLPKIAVFSSKLAKRGKPPDVTPMLKSVLRFGEEIEDEQDT